MTGKDIPVFALGYPCMYQLLTPYPCPICNPNNLILFSQAELWICSTLAYHWDHMRSASPVKNYCDREGLSLCKELRIWKLGSYFQGHYFVWLNWKCLILPNHNLHYVFHLSEWSLNLEPGYNRLVCREEGTKLHVVMANHFSQLYSREKRKTQLNSCPSSWPLT